MAKQKGKIIFEKKKSSLEPFQKLPGVRVDFKSHMRIYEIARLTGVTMSEVIRKLIVEGLEIAEIIEEDEK
ncbi:hypothetical protein [Listeria fleischmannii]|uniref:Uncharacterized protein n=1 Tax=Listeria fleischmannii FSL S10-1203 TaxID=1265822 RepID=W7DQP0_9LIST|nr:hypothetical protein [Listeria fleischmannii]EUJ64827.1 hypothetical protein MCOL2_01470 [Listeria fleischmannii FSL S10-1203]